MDNTIYVALSKQMAMFRDLDNTAQNIAHVDTTGYQSSKMMFTSYLMKEVPQKDSVHFNYDIDTYTDTTPGALKTTGNALDVAIEGEGYFTVQTPGGNRYTRAGSFQLDANGTMVNASNYPVLDVNNQPIIFGTEDTDILIGQNGTIKVNGEERTQIGIVNFANPQLLQRVGNTMYRSEIAPQVIENPVVAQGMLERSNVRAASELTHMMKLSRSVSSTAKMIEVMYDLERKTSDGWTQQV